MFQRVKTFPSLPARLFYCISHTVYFQYVHVPYQMTFLFRDGQEILQICISTITKLQTPKPRMETQWYCLSNPPKILAGRCTLQVDVPQSTRELRKVTENVQCCHLVHLSHYLPTKTVLELLFAQNYIAFAIAECEIFVCKQGTAAVWAIYNLWSLKHNTILRPRHGPCLEQTLKHNTILRPRYGPCLEQTLIFKLWTFAMLCSYLCI